MKIFWLPGGALLFALVVCLSNCANPQGEGDGVRAERGAFTNARTLFGAGAVWLSRRA